jgi:hypothetical protein
MRTTSSALHTPLPSPPARRTALARAECILLPLSRWACRAGRKAPLCAGLQGTYYIEAGQLHHLGAPLSGLENEAPLEPGRRAGGKTGLTTCAPLPAEGPSRHHVFTCARALRGWRALGRPTPAIHEREVARLTSHLCSTCPASPGVRRPAPQRRAFFATTPAASVRSYGAVAAPRLGDCGRQISA